MNGDVLGLLVSMKKCDRLMITFLHRVCMLRLIACVIASSESLINFTIQWISYIVMF